MRNFRRKIIFCIWIICIIYSLNVDSNPLFISEDKKVDNKIDYNSSTIISDGPVVEWVKNFGGAGNDRGNSVVQTFDGGFVLTGFTRSYGSSEADMWLIKTDYNGDMEWNRSFGGLTSEWGRSVIQTSKGDYLIVGGTESYGVGLNDVWLIKTDNQGNEIWNKTYGGCDYDCGFSILETLSNDYILTGYTKSFGSGSQDLWLIKTDSKGNLIWNKTFGGLGDEKGAVIQQTGDNGYIITGYTSSWGTGICDVWLIKIDESGNEQWNKTYGNAFISMGLSVQQTIDGGFIISGTQDDIDYGNSEIWLIKTDSNGNIIWDKLFCGEFNSVGFSVVQTDDGGYFITGYTNSYYDFRWPDMYLIKTDENGFMMWDETIGGKDADVCFSMSKTSDGGLILIGFTEFYNESSFDVCLIKIAPFENNHPDKPSRPSGEISGKTGDEYIYQTSTTDSDGDQVWYKWYWNDKINETSGWLGPYDSGDTCEASHSWDEDGDYEIKVKAKDLYGDESPWSDPLTVAMPRVKIFNQIPKILIWLFERFPFLEQFFSHFI